MSRRPKQKQPAKQTPTKRYICPVKRCRSCINLNRCDPPKSLRDIYNPVWWCTVVGKACEEAVKTCLESIDRGFNYWRHK
nr:MAG TPA: hypothetical protein [Caudoviricetes sp.]